MLKSMTNIRLIEVLMTLSAQAQENSLDIHSGDASEFLNRGWEREYPAYPRQTIGLSQDHTSEDNHTSEELPF